MHYKKLREVREDFDMSRKQVAQILEITSQQYQLYESGKREMPTHLFIKLAEYYEVTTDYLVGRSNDDYSDYVSEKQKTLSYYYQKIRDIREDKDLYQHQVSDLLGITRQQYQLYESGKREMPMHLFIKLADYYEVTIDYLVGRDKRGLFDYIE